MGGTVGATCKCEAEKCEAEKCEACTGPVLGLMRGGHGDLCECEQGGVIHSECS